MDNQGNRDGTAVSTYVYATTHIHSKTICTAFAEGSRLTIVPADKYFRGNAVVYGRLRGCNEILTNAKIRGYNWYYIDRGYLRATRDHDYSGYFRITKNALQCDGLGRGDLKRFQKLHLHIRDWRKSGSHILICPPGKTFANLSNFDVDKWTSNVINQLKQYTDRELRVRPKPLKDQRVKSLISDLNDCWAVVTHSSNSAVEALLNGVPVFCTDVCASYHMGYSDLSKIESPKYPNDRLRWATVLASSQWTLDEFRSGLAWSMLNAT